MASEGAGAGSWPKASGVALAALVAVQLGVGFYLNAQYAPTPSQARQAVEAIRSAPVQSFLQGVHYWGSAWLILHGLFHVMLLLWTGAYLRVSKGAWLGGLLLLGSALAMQITGNLLPFDRHDAATALVEGGIAQRTPIVGEAVRSSVMGGGGLGVETLVRWHSFHLWLLVPLVIGAVLALEPRQKIPGKIRFLWGVPVAQVGGLSLLLPAPYGPAASITDLSADAAPSWYVLPMHGALSFFEGLSPGLGWLGTVLLPGLFGLLLFVAPWLGRKRDGLVRARAAGFAVVFILVSLPVLDAAAPLWGSQEIAAESNAPRPGEASPMSAKVDEAKAAAGLELAKLNCTGCHGKDLRGAFGTPNLLEVHLKRGSDADWYVRFLQNPRAIRSRTTMPSFAHFGQNELAKIAEFLRSPGP